MPDKLRLWMRHEARPTERRAALAPEDARRLIERGVHVTVEESAQRVFPAQDYARSGCEIVAQGSWVDHCPGTDYVLGVKELPTKPALLTHRHIFFGHAYKRQAGAERLLRRFAAGGGSLLDLEYLVDEAGCRVAAFGYWAGYAGASLAVLRHRGVLRAPLAALSKGDMDERLRPPRLPRRSTAVVIGARGRSGRGACDALRAAGIEPTRWGHSNTRNLDRDALLAHDILVNAIVSDRPVPPFLTDGDLDGPYRRLSVICDVTCDVGSEHNALPVYDRPTDWESPAERLREGPRPLDVIAVDNLPSLIPAEASRAFSAELWPHLLSLREGSEMWQRCLDRFHRAIASISGHG